jgi:hypothetical protein
MAFESEHEELLFCIEMALRHCRTSQKVERNEFTRRIQAKAIVEHLTGCGWKIVRDERDTGQQPSNIGV